MEKNLTRKLYASKPISSIINLLSSPWQGRGAILMYHRILPDERMKEDLNLGLAVSSSNFLRQMEVLKSKYKICSINEFVDNLKKNIKEFMIAVTFDDGYKDNFTFALPILEKYKVPASIYITTKFLKENVNMWWFELGEVIQNNSKLNFVYQKKVFNFNIQNYKQKLSSYSKLTEIFLKLNLQEQNEALEIITNSKERKNYAKICLNSEEVRILDRHPLITIGTHGHNHLNYKILTDEEVRFDVTKSLEILESLLNHKIKHFCYPYGKKEQAGEREYSIIKNLNFNSALTGRTFPIKDNQFFSLPRIYVGEKTCEKTLVNNLSGFYNFSKKFF